MDESDEGFGVLAGHKPGGSGSGACRKARLRLIGVAEVPPARVHDRDLLKQLRRLQTDAVENEVLCQQCRYWFLGAIRKKRKEVWERIQAS